MILAPLSLSLISHSEERESGARPARSRPGGEGAAEGGSGQRLRSDLGR